MSVRNLWALEPGECITAYEILRKIKDCAVFFPVHDVGVDLLAVKGKKHVAIQVKESRYFTDRPIRGAEGHSWHRIDIRKLEKYRENVDFVVFLTYVAGSTGSKVGHFEYKFLVVPILDLLKSVQFKNPGRRGVYSFYFYFAGSRVFDVREKTGKQNSTDYSKYLGAWDLIKEALS